MASAGAREHQSSSPEIRGRRRVTSDHLDGGKKGNENEGKKKEKEKPAGTTQTLDIDFGVLLLTRAARRGAGEPPTGARQGMTTWIDPSVARSLLSRYPPPLRLSQRAAPQTAPRGNGPPTPRGGPSTPQGYGAQKLTVALWRASQLAQFDSHNSHDDHTNKSSD